MESTLYASTGLNQINVDNPQLAINTLAKDIGGNTYSSVATRNDVSRALAADSKATTALEESGLIFESIINSSNYDELKAAVIAAEVATDLDDPDPVTDPNDPNYNG